MSSFESAKETYVPISLVDEIIQLSEDLHGEFAQLLTAPQVALGRINTEGSTTTIRASSGSFWQNLRVGDAVLNLELFHWGNYLPPRTLTVLRDQRWDWPCSLGIEYPAVSNDGFSVRSAMSRKPGVGYFEIRPTSGVTDLRLISYNNAEDREGLLNACGASDEQNLWDILERAVRRTEQPTKEYSDGIYSLAIKTAKASLPNRETVLKISKSQGNGTVQEQNVTQNHIEITVWNLLQFIARWAIVSSDDNRLKLQFTNRNEHQQSIGEGDIALIRRIGQRLLHSYASHLSALRYGP